MTSPVNFVPRKKVAVVGSGSAGIAALWALNRTHHDVYLYEAEDRLGGHTNTAEWRQGKYKTLVDTGFIVLNKATYRQRPSRWKSVQPTDEPQRTSSASWIRSTCR
jgi:predicted NAD/FAD-binding protein